MKGQATSLIGVVVSGVLALIISAIVIYAVAFPVTQSMNTSLISAVNGSGQQGGAPLTTALIYQQGNMTTLFLLYGVMVIVIALVVFLMVTRLVG